jgi:hypothetical protein
LFCRISFHPSTSIEVKGNECCLLKFTIIQH